MKKKLFLIFALILFSSLPVFSQTPDKTPVEEDDGDDVVKISTNLIQLDVTVTDKKGIPVRDLKPEDFEVYENGRLQEISGFSFVSGRRTIQPPAATAAAPAGQKSPQPVRPEQVRRTIALVVDDLTLSFQSVYYVRRALKKFVDEQMQEGDLVAIVRTGSSIGALQQFTTDRRVLYTAIEKIGWNPRGNGNIGAFNAINAIRPDTIGRDLNPEADTEFDVLEESNIGGKADTEIYNYQESRFATGTLGAIDYIIRGMRELPGRKSVMVMSDGFKLLTQRPRGFVETNRIYDSLRRLTDLANRSSVVVYTMDARGQQTASMTAEDNLRLDAQDTYYEDRIGQLRNSQDGLIYLARQTGGLAVVNNNDLSGGIRSMLADQSYYLVAYEPDDETFDPKKRQFNRLEIKVKRPDVIVRYRSGFFNISDEKVKQQISNLSAQQRLADAITSPFSAGEISLRLNTLFGNDRTSGLFVRSFLHIDPRDIEFTDAPDGTKKAVIDVLATSFGDNGIVLGQTGSTYNLEIKKDSYQKFLRDGFVFDFTFPIKKAGAYQYRVAVMDGGSKKVGTASEFLEIPNLKKDRLTLSGIMLENIPQKQWQRMLNDLPPAAAEEDLPNPLIATSLRRFTTNSILNYGFQIFNAKLGSGKKPDLSAKIRLLRGEGEVVLDGKLNPVEIKDQTDFDRVAYTGGFGLGENLTPGDYLLQITVTDNLADAKRNTVTQFVPFEIVK